MLKLRSNRRGVGFGSVALLFVLILVAGSFIVLVDNETMLIEGRVYDVRAEGDTIKVNLDVRVTNRAGQDLVVQEITVRIWADAERTIELTSATLSGLAVSAGKQNTFTLPLVIHNSDYFSGKVWIDAESVWLYGNDYHRESVVGREFSVDGALAQL